MKKREILFARNWCFHDFNFKRLHSSSFLSVGFFVFFAISGLGKVLWFCLTKVSGKHQSYTNSYWFCKNWHIGTKSGEKTKLARYPENQKFQEITKYSELKNFNSKCKKVFYCIFKSVLCKSLIVLIVTLLYCILHVYVELCTNRAFGSVKRYLTLPGT